MTINCRYIYDRITLILGRVTTLGILALLFSGMTTASYAAGGLPAGIEVNLSKAIGTNQNGEILVTIAATNTTNNRIEFSRINTVLDYIQTRSYFDVIGANGKLSMLLPTVKRINSVETSRISLDAGEEISHTVNLKPYFEWPALGKYSVSLVGQNELTSLSSSKSLAVEFTLDKNPITPIRDLNIQSKRTIATRACSTSEVSQIDQSLIEAERFTKKAALDLQNTPVNERNSAPRYRRWFGAFSSSRYELALSNFRLIDEAFAEEQISVDCSCELVSPTDRDFIFAYVLPNREFVVTVCGAFWRAPVTGIDSRAGTLVHEMSHFSSLGAANNASQFPEVYGTSAALNLAVNNPLHAVNNAENYNYYAENTPAFTMSAADVPISQCSATQGSITSTSQPNGIIPALNNAADNASLSLLNGNPGFIISGFGGSTGGTALVSQNISDNQRADLTLLLNGPGTLQFDWGVSSESNFDFLVASLFDSSNALVVQDFISGEVALHGDSMSIPSGAHTLLWTYIKDGSVSIGSDRGFVDNIRDFTANRFNSSNIPSTQVSCGVGEITIAPILQLLILDED